MKVGYGDYHPTTTIGRIATFLLGIWGICNVSLFVYTFSNLLEMESSENKALNLLTRLKDREQSKKIATEIVKNIFRYKHEKDKSFFKCNHKKHLLKIRKLTNKFRKVNKYTLFIIY